jgi:hypothetical protein
MELREYFDNKSGLGVIATADSEGKVDTAIYSKPRFTDEDNIAFITADRLTHHNLQSNPYACYLFKESGEGYKGKRLYLKKTGEEKDREVIDRFLGSDRFRNQKLYMVYFHIEKVLPLVGE